MWINVFQIFHGVGNYQNIFLVSKSEGHFQFNKIDTKS